VIRIGASLFAMLMITLAVCWTRTPVADLPLLPNLDSEIVDPLTRS